MIVNAAREPGRWEHLREAVTGWRARVWHPPRHPVFQHELGYWDQRLGGRWRLEEFFALCTLANLCLLPAALLVFPWLLVVYALFDEMIGLFITLPAALLVVRERERGTWEILRSTPAGHAELAVGKISGLLYVVWEGTFYIARARWFGTLLSLPLFALMLTLADAFPLAEGLPPWLVTGTLALTYATFIVRPLINLLFGGTLGLALSTVTRSSAEALTWAALAGAAWLSATGIVLFFFVQQHGGWILFSESVLAARLAQIFVWLLPLAALSALRLALLPVCFAVAVWRIAR